MSQRSVYERANQEESFREMLKQHGAYGRVQKVQRAEPAYQGKTPNNSLQFSVISMEGEHSMSKQSPKGPAPAPAAAKPKKQDGGNVVDEQLKARRDKIEEENSREASKQKERRPSLDFKNNEKATYNFAGRRPSQELKEERENELIRSQMASTMPALPKIAGAQEQSMMSSTYSMNMSGFESVSRTTFAQQRKLQGAWFQRKTMAAFKSQAEGNGNAADVQGLRRMLKTKYGE